MLEIIKLGFSVGLGVMAALTVLCLGVIVLIILIWAVSRVGLAIMDAVTEKMAEREMKSWTSRYDAPPCKEENHAEED